MAKFLITVFRDIGFDANVVVDQAMMKAIDALNSEMIASGVQTFVGGLMPIEYAKSFKYDTNNVITESEESYIKASEFIDGLWVLECPDLKSAQEWARKAAMACRASVEIRPFYG
ncbi:YciI family protein [Sessilibacter sp. MAH4]